MQVVGQPPNNSFKPNLLRYTNNVAGKACHVVGYATQVGLTQALEPFGMITAAEFRNSSLASLLVGYDWPSGAHFADLTLTSADGSLLTYRISELSAWSAFEDFQAQHIEQCTLLHDQSGVYLALDPYLEGQRSPQDNLWFAGISVELVPGSNNSFKPKPLRSSKGMA